MTKNGPRTAYADCVRGSTRIRQKRVTTEEVLPHPSDPVFFLSAKIRTPSAYAVRGLFWIRHSGFFGHWSFVSGHFRAGSASRRTSRSNSVRGGSWLPP